jgi:monoamine oxidase
MRQTVSDEFYDPYPWIRRDEPFSLGRLFDHPGDELWGIESEKKRVCIIGGGVGGLAAAYELKWLDHDVTLLEASARIGGRILTDRCGTTYGELGAMRIPLSHYCVRHYIQSFGLPLRPFVQSNDEAFVLLKGSTGRIRRRDLAANFNTLEPTIRKVDAHIGDGIAWLDAWRIFEQPELDQGTLLWSKASIWQYVQRWIAPGIRPTLRERRPLLSRDEWEFAGRIEGLIWDEQASLLEAAVDWLIFNDPAMFEIPGGMDGLTNAFAAFIGADISTNSTVRAVDISPTEARVTWVQEDGGLESRPFDFVICAIPASCVSRIEWSPELPNEQWEALTKISYGSAAKVAIHCDRRLWELNDGIFGGVSRTDLPIEQVSYPSDHAAPSNVQFDPDAQVSDPGLSATIALTADRGLTYMLDVSRWQSTAGVNPDDPGTILGYMHGDNARRFASLPGNVRDEVVKSSLEQLHPGIRAHVMRVGVMAWDEEVNPGRGAFAMFNPGEHVRYGEWIGRPLGGRVFFAGEHTAGAHAWVQTSIQTALGAVWRVLAA